jgi:hypothetical protein
LDQYFAAKSGEELAAELQERLTGFRSGLEQNGQFELWEKSFDLYFGRHFNKAGKKPGTALVSMGEKGELTGFAANHYRNLIKHILTLTTNQKVAFDTRAVNTDLKSIQQTRLGNNILDYYVVEKKIGRYTKKAAEHAQVFGKGFVKAVWDPGLGKPYAADPVTGDDGQPMTDEEGKPLMKIVREGDPDASAPFPWQVLVDEDEEDWNKCDWVAVTALKNKFSLAARYPTLRDQITALPSVGETQSQTQWFKLQKRARKDSIAQALVEVIEFYHRKSDALPEGRYMISAGGVVLYDGPYQYEERLPVFRVVPGELIGSTEGYSDAFDLQGPQDAYNVILSTVFSNLQALGVNVIWTPEGTNISKDQIKGLVLMKGPAGGEPKAINLSNTPDVLFKTLDVIERLMETLSGVNSVARGNPESSLDSGVALGLVQSMAVQFASAFQESWAELNADVGTFLLTGLIRPFAKTKRQVALGGKHNKGYMAEYMGDDLSSIDRVMVDVGNPIMKTTAGRMQIADKMLDRGLIKNPQQYLTFLSSGTYEPMVESEENQLSLIRKENEDLMEGKEAIAIVGDSHVLHAQEHRSVLSDPMIRTLAAKGDPLASQIIKNVQTHINMHKQLAESQDPFWAAISGETPIAPPPPPPGPPMDGGPMPPPDAPQPPIPEMLPPNEIPAQSPGNLPQPQAGSMPGGPVV